MTFGNRLSVICEQKNISHQKLAEWLNVSPRTITRIMNGQSQLDIDKLIVLSNNLNVSADYLLGISNVADVNEWQLKKINAIRTRWKKSMNVGNHIGASVLDYVITEMNKKEE